MPLFLQKPGWVFSKILYRSLTWRKPNAPDKTLYLTFDDGPIPHLTEFVLDTLAHYHIPATFFCVGHNIVKHPHIYRRILAEGHRTGNHTFNHLNGWQHPNSVYLANVAQCRNAMQQQSPETGKPLFRPPYGRLNYKQIADLLPDYDIIMWSVLTGDFSAALTPEKCLKTAIRLTDSGSIIVFHDNLKAEANLRYALPRYIEHFLAQQYQFATL